MIFFFFTFCKDRDPWYIRRLHLFSLSCKVLVPLLPFLIQYNFPNIQVDKISSPQSYLLSFWTYHSEEAHILSILDVKSIDTGQILNKPYKCTHHPFNTNNIWYYHFFPNYLFLHTPCEGSFHTSTQISATTSKSKAGYSPTFNHPPSNLLFFFNSNSS